MIPIGDDNVPGSRLQIVNILLVIANVLVFLVELSLSEAGLAAFFEQYAVVPARVLQGQNLHSLITSMFLHGGWFHLIGNMVFLLVFGDNIEAVLGHLGYLLFYLAGGVVASLAHVAFNASSTVPSLGASGAIAAALGAYLVMFPRSRIRVLLILGFFITTARVAAVAFLLIWAVMQVFNGLASLAAETAQTAGVAYWAHIGGFVFGLLVGVAARGRANRLTRGYPSREVSRYPWSG